LGLLGAVVPPLRAVSAPDATQAFAPENSDPRAIRIADQVMEALGGRDAWNRTHYLRWNFFGRRTHLWDKWTGDLRTELVDSDGRRVVLCMNLQTLEGRVWIDGEELTDETRLAEWIRRGRSMWINDSYWLLMPYKLEDPGVELGYGGETTLEDGRPADRLVLTFDGVGETPQNRYEVLVSRDRHLVEQWSYFENSSDTEPRLTTPWRGWKRYGEILLSGDRGDSHITDIAVFDHVDRALFEKP
jgi:hypothetical protein